MASQVLNKRSGAGAAEHSGASEKVVAVDSPRSNSSGSSNPLAAFLENFSGRSEYVLQAIILFAICVLAFSLRLFSVLRYESVIHEFDPWFNFRSTKYLVQEGFYNFFNWYDSMAWYPFGRFVGGTVYPGLMWTAAVFFHFLQNVLHFTVNIRNTCVFLSPFMASNTALAVYLLTKEVWSGGAGIVAAAFVALAPGYVSRSVAGSYDNEAIAIFALVFAFFLWVRAVNTGSIFWGAAAALGYYYMVAAWGGYVFIINIIPVHVFALIVAGRFSRRLYVAYSTFYVIGTLISMTVPFVGFQPVSLRSPEHLASMGIFLLLQIYVLFDFVKSILPERHTKTLVRWMATGMVGFVGLLVLAAASGRLPFFTARLLSLLGATSNIAIVKSVSEHQPSSWTTFFFDLHCIVFLVPVGMYFCFKHLSDANLFVVLYACFAAYFSAIMVRLVLVLTPAACVLAGIGAHVILSTFSDVLVTDLFSRRSGSNNANRNKQQQHAEPRFSSITAALIIVGFAILFYFFTIHCTWVTSSAYSSPSIILMGSGGRGERVIFDDYREAYTWLRHNTPLDAKVMSWWDYGYQITGMANRTVIVDNNTRNNTHIATVGLALASGEERAYEVMKQFDVDYVLVVFGGRIGYSSDDINKFLWMVRIASGVYPEIEEQNFYNHQGQYRVDSGASWHMRNSIMHKMCFYRFNEVGGFDRVRQASVRDLDIQLNYLEEAFTTEHWMVRIYKVKNEKSHPGFLERLEREKKLQVSA